MASYEKAINFIILENDIKSTEELKDFGEEENCKFSKAYFKTVQDGANDCIFKTADRVWWDITDLTNPILILKDSLKDKTKTELQTLAKNINDKTVFSMVGRFDDIGTLRVNDNAYEQGLSNNLINQAYMIKLWHFINNNVDFNAKEQFRICKISSRATCEINVNGILTTYTKVTIGNNSISFQNDSCKSSCPYITSESIADNYYIASYGSISSAEAAEFGSYYKAAKYKCESQGARLPKAAEWNYLGGRRHLPRDGAAWLAEDGYYSNYIGVIGPRRGSTWFNVWCISD